MLLASNCSGTCIQKYRVGQAVTVAYSPTNPSYAQLSTRLPEPSTGFLYALFLFGSFGVVFLGAAVVNMKTA
ncbi:MAG: DUF3592 domain-containing protein [Nocardiopsaceae bacterium]|nr:DUF3592 domain-containing protein [Nocardiopsaceae bacterium]